jgi:hypothetical protein
MRYQSRISVSSRQGTYDQSLDRAEIDKQLKELHGENFRTVKLLIVAWSSLLADSPSDLKPAFVIHRFVKRLVNDLQGCLFQFAELAHNLETSLRFDESGNVFIDRFIEEFKGTPIFKEYLNFYETRDPHLLSFILTFLYFGKKVEYKDDDLEATALRGWFEVEERLDNLVLPGWVTNLKRIVHAIFADWSEGAFLPKHGGGAVAQIGIKGVNTKNYSMVIPPVIDYMYYKSMFADKPECGSIYPDSEYAHVSSDTRKVSRLMFVPKNWKTARTINMEPTSYQWAQQGVRLWYEHFLKHCWLAGHIQLARQEANQEAACAGSLGFGIDTLDLSAASDSVAWKLVKAIFPAGVLKHLAATRTSLVELPDGTILEVSKYAPMGSALCFPVQSTIYSAIILMVSFAQLYGKDWRVPGSLDDVDIALAWKHAYAKPFTLRRGSGYIPFRVYGDDIACDERVTSNVIAALSDLGFKVNTEKSFRGLQAFRESCGKRYFHGADVSPMIFKCGQITKRVETDVLAGLIDQANRAGEYGYVSLRRHLIQFILYADIKGVQRRGKDRRNPILFSSDRDESMALLHDQPVNKHLKHRYYDGDRLTDDSRSWYQRDEVHSLTVGPKTKEKPSEEFDSYYHGLWWRARYEDAREVSVEFSETVFTADTLITGARWRWTPT